MSFGGEIGVTPPGRRPGQWYMDAVHWPDYHALPSYPYRQDLKRIQCITFGDGLTAGVAGKLTVNRL